MLPIRASILAAILTIAVLAGCTGLLAPRSSRHPDREVAATAAASPRLFYPLDLGNHWSFHRVFTLGTAGSPTPTVRRSLIDHDLVCVDTLEGRKYVIDRITQIDSTLAGPITYFQWIRNRQDPTGLYEADVEIGSAPACAGDVALAPPEETGWLADWRASATFAAADPVAIERATTALERRLQLARQALSSGAGGLENGEITRLQYPMVVGRTWTIREDPHFTSTVEALEMLHLPVGDVQAYRVRVDAEGLGPNDRVLSWYSRSGLVGILVHIEIPTGTGALIAEDVIDLEELSIGRGRF